MIAQALALHALTGDTDIVFGVVTSGRSALTAGGQVSRPAFENTAYLIEIRATARNPRSVLTLS